MIGDGIFTRPRTTITLLPITGTALSSPIGRVDLRRHSGSGKFRHRSFSHSRAFLGQDSFHHDLDRGERFENSIGAGGRRVLEQDLCRNRHRVQIGAGRASQRDTAGAISPENERRRTEQKSPSRVSRDAQKHEGRFDRRAFRRRLRLLFHRFH